MLRILFCLLIRVFRRERVNYFSITNLTLWYLSIVIDGDVEYFFKSDKIIEIRLCLNQSCWDHGQSCSFGNIVDQSR